MTAPQLLAILDGHGALLKVEGGKLLYRLPRALGHLRPDIREHRDELVTLITTQAICEANARYRERWGEDADLPTIQLCRWVVHSQSGRSMFTAEELVANVEARGGYFELEGKGGVQLVVWVPVELAIWTAPLQRELRCRHAELIELMRERGDSPRAKLAKLLRSRFQPLVDEGVSPLGDDGESMKSARETVGATEQRPTQTNRGQGAGAQYP